ncbi:MAG: hypothetical protein NTU53_13610 [Planctomycetota bacterium]|nr:hypothetical protein [Planctomycetota bacterium]
MNTQTRESQSAPITIPSRPGEPVAIPSIHEILTTTDPDRFVARHTDIAAVNLACATGLPNAEDIDIPKCLALLDRMAGAVRQHTEQSWRLFKIKPAEFRNSENVFRVLMMEHVLRVQFKVKYDPLVREAVRTDKEWNTSDSSAIFIHGILNEKRTGTCSSLPTFSIAVGRRLGYPLKLVRVPNHTVFRWDDPQEKVNFQHTKAGTDIRSDEYFHTWPEKWDETMYELNARCKVWLHSMTPRQEVSKFLCNRALILREIGRFPEALHALQAAARFDPINPACPDIRSHIQQKTTGGVDAPQAAASLSQSARAFLASPLALPIEPGPDQLLNALDVFRDRSKDPEHLHVRITRIAEEARQANAIKIVRLNLQEKERTP